jgi:hypothetical protein
MKRTLQPAELLAVLEKAMARHEQDRAALNELARLKQQAQYDDLTGLCSMRAVQAH